MSCLKYLTNNAVIATFVVGGFVSIGISAWQFQGGESENNYPGNWQKDVCETYPYEYLRPFSLNRSDMDGPLYCGYTASNTGYRLAIAIITVIIAVLMFFKVFGLGGDNASVTWVVLLINAVFWFSATVVDCSTLSNASLSCNDKNFFGGYYNCNNARFGITIAVDICLAVVSYLAWFVVTSVDAPAPAAPDKV